MIIRKLETVGPSKHFYRYTKIKRTETSGHFVLCKIRNKGKYKE